MWKTTNRYGEMKKAKALDKESKLKQVICCGVFLELCVHFFSNLIFNFCGSNLQFAL